MSNGFAPLPNKASVIVDAYALLYRPPRRHASDYVRPPRRQHPAWTGTALGFLAGVAVAGFWLIA